MYATFVEKVQALKQKRKEKSATPEALPQERQSSIRSTHIDPIKNMGLIGWLPYEIRQMVYLQALGDRLLHLVSIPAPNRLGQFDCRLTASASHVHTLEASRSLWLPWDGMLALLQSCRQIHLEASTILYTTNTFAVFGAQEIPAFVSLSRTITGDRLASIARLYINFSVYEWEATSGHRSLVKPEFRGHWEAMCNVMATKMPGLKYLSIHLTTSNAQSLLDHQEEWTASLLAIQGLRTLDFGLESTRRADRIVESRLVLLREQLQEQLCAPVMTA